MTVGARVVDTRTGDRWAASVVATSVGAACAVDPVVASEVGVVAAAAETGAAVVAERDELATDVVELEITGSSAAVSGRAEAPSIAAVLVAAIVADADVVTPATAAVASVSSGTPVVTEPSSASASVTIADGGNVLTSAVENAVAVVGGFVDDAPVGSIPTSESASPAPVPTVVGSAWTGETVAGSVVVSTSPLTACTTCRSAS